MERKYRIVPKRDFGSGKGFLIDGEFVKHGFVVTDGFCNIMPGATWFQTVADAMRGLRIWIECGGTEPDGELSRARLYESASDRAVAAFWTRIREPRQ